MVDEKAPQGRVRRTQLNIRLSTSEVEELRLRAAEKGMSMTDYIVYCTLHGEAYERLAAREMVARDRKDIRDLAAKVDRVARLAGEIEKMDACDEDVRGVLLDVADRLRMFSYGCEADLGKAMDAIGEAYKSCTYSRH